MSNLMLDLSGIVNEAIDEKLSKFDIEGRIKELLGDVAKSASKVLTVKVDGKSGETKLPLVHRQFEQLLNVACIKGLNVLLTGGAGLSKSTAVEQLADALQLELSSISFSNQTTKTDLLGFIDANGIYRMSGFIDAFKNGKIFLADEMDACSSNVLVLLNSAIANGRIETPDNKVIYAHDNFRFIATANTNLRGAKNGYTARNKLDTATIDRFVVIEWELDLDLEQKLTNNDGWLEIVRTARKSAEDRLEGITITPRSSYDGAKLIQAGINIDQVIRMTIIKAMGKDEEMVLLKDITQTMKNKAVKVSKKEVEAFKEEVKEIIIPTVTAEVVETEEDDFKW